MPKRKIRIIKTNVRVPKPVTSLRSKELSAFSISAPMTTLPAAPIPTFSTITPLPETINLYNTNVEPFNALIGINADKLEIIALTEFLPCYSDEKLNKTGQFFQAKQDALLVSCADGLINVFNLIKKQKDLEETNQITIKKSLDFDKRSIYDFCDIIDINISSFLAVIENTKSSFNFKTDFSKVINDIKNLPQEFKDISSIDELTNVLTSTERQSWTATKTWLQMCLELKEALKHGTFLKDGLFVPSNDTRIAKSNDAYSISDMSNVNIRFGFNSTQRDYISLFDGNLNITDATSLNVLKSLLTDVFTKQASSILNVSMASLIGSSREEKSKSIAKLSYLISRELHYSTELRRLRLSNSDIASEYGYDGSNLDKAGNISFWDAIIGKSGKDITEIPTNPLSLNSLTSLAQRIESAAGKKYEILTFENAYINDDVNSTSQTARTATMTPGTTYYIDGALTPKTFFKSPAAESFKTDVSTALNSLKDLFSSRGESSYQTQNVSSNFLFNNEFPRSINEIVGMPLPPREGLEFQASAQQSTNVDSATDLSYKNINKIIKNPLRLIRFLENKLLTANFLTRTSLPSDSDSSMDFSAPIISFALNDIDRVNKDGNNLLSLIYIYVLAKTDAFIKQNDNKSTNNNTDLILTEIKKYFIEYSTQQQSTSNNTTQEFKNVPLNKIDAADLTLNTLNKIAIILASIAIEFRKTDSEFDAVDATINPFANVIKFDSSNNTIKSFYSGIQKESIMSLIFFLCCLMINEVNHQRIESVVQNFNDRGYYFKTIKVKTYDKSSVIWTDVDDYYIGDTLMSYGYQSSNIYAYDDIISQAEVKIYKEITDLKKMSSWFVCYLTILENNLNNFISEFQDDKNFSTKVWAPISLVIGNDDLAEQILNVEQLNLIKAKLSYMKTRLSTTYDSGLKQLTPYFVSLKNEDKQILNSILPLEDLHIASWNFLLKDYLNKPKLNSDAASNLKILSVGVPHKLYQTLQKPTEASNSGGSKPSQNLVSINVYLIDHLRPTLIHKPKKFIFDLKKFPIRVLNYYLDEALVTLNPDNQSIGSQYSDLKSIKYLPFLNLQDFQSVSDLTTVNIIDEGSQRYLDAGLEVEQIEQLKTNHIDSIFFEEYLRFTSGVSFDEHSFFNFDKKAKSIDASMIRIPVNTRGALEYFKNTIFIGTDEIKKMLVMPKKFDRVFHVAFDPDDFEIDTTYDEFGNINIIDYYVQQGIIVKIANLDDSPVDEYKRAVTSNSNVEFNSYHVVLESIT